MKSKIVWSKAFGKLKFYTAYMIQMDRSEHFLKLIVTLGIIYNIMFVQHAIRTYLPPPLNHALTESLVNVGT